MLALVAVANSHRALPTIRALRPTRVRFSPSLIASTTAIDTSTNIHWISSTTSLKMRKDAKGKGPGKVIAKNNLPSKVCVVCNRPFTWRKKWERVWDEVTCCSKSCNAKRRSNAKDTTSDALVNDGVTPISTTNSVSSSNNASIDGSTAEAVPKQMTQKELRKQHKEAVKAQKQERRDKRMGNAPELGRKPCDLCQNEVDLLVRCTVDESKQFKMVCGKCWPSVSGGVPDGSLQFPNYTYGGLWKNRNANLKKRIGSGPKKDSKSIDANASTLLDEVDASLTIDDHEGIEDL